MSVSEDTDSAGPSFYVLGSMPQNPATMWERNLGPHGVVTLRVPGGSRPGSERPADDLRPQPVCVPAEVPVSVHRDKPSLLCPF